MRESKGIAPPCGDEGCAPTNISNYLLCKANRRWFLCLGTSEWWAAHWITPLTNHSPTLLIAWIPIYIADYAPALLVLRRIKYVSEGGERWRQKQDPPLTPWSERTCGAEDWWPRYSGLTGVKMPTGGVWDGAWRTNLFLQAEPVGIPELVNNSLYSFPFTVDSMILRRLQTKLIQPNNKNKIL